MLNAPKTVPAFTGIHGRDEHEVCGKGDTARRAAHGNLPIFQDLPQRFQRGALELR